MLLLLFLLVEVTVDFHVIDFVHIVVLVATGVNNIV